METLETSKERVVSPEDFHLPENNSLGITQFAEQLGMKAPVLSNIIKKALIVEKDYFDNDYGGIRIIHFKPTGSKKLAIAISERNKATNKVPLVKTMTTEQVQEVIHGQTRGEIEGELKSDKEISALKGYWEESSKSHSDWFKKTYGRPMILKTEHIEEFKKGLTDHTHNRDRAIQEIIKGGSKKI